MSHLALLGILTVVIGLILGILAVARFNVFPDKPPIPNSTSQPRLCTTFYNYFCCSLLYFVIAFSLYLLVVAFPDMAKWILKSFAKDETFKSVTSLFEGPVADWGVPVIAFAAI